MEAELYFAMLEVGKCAQEEQVPGPLAETMLCVAKRCCTYWAMDPKLIHDFAKVILTGPTDLKSATYNLPPLTGQACWRLIDLLDAVATLREPEWNQSCRKYTTAQRDTGKE